MNRLILFFIVLLSGCAAPIQATRDLPQPGSLADVNALLDGKRVTIDLADGESIEWVRNAVVSGTEVQYTISAPGPTPGRISVSTPIDDVLRITYVRNRGTRVGAAVGAAPGVYSLVAGAGMLRGGGSVGTQLGGLVILLISVPQTFVGAAFGGWVGQGVSPGGIVPLYEAPVERYLPPTAVPVAEPTDR